MKNFLFLIFLFCFILENSYNNISNSYAGLRFVDFVLKLGYSVQDHTVVTKDGYILTVYRIHHDKKYSFNNNNRSTVLLGHGFMNCAKDFINSGHKSLPIFLSKAGYDVWLTNNRGTSYSKNHTVLSSDNYSRKYWDFSFHEIGMYDYASIIDYIIEKTGQLKIFYIGHSQGGTSMFVLLSEQPEYNNKLRLFTGLAPSTALKHTKSPMIKIGTNLYHLINLAREKLNFNVFISDTNKITKFAIKFCSDGAITQQFCPYLLYFMLGYSPFQMNMTLLPVIYSNFPEAASTKQALHYIQGIITGIFSKYDYGIENWEKYNSSKPPEYDLSKITCPVAIYNAQNDLAVTEKDIKYTEKNISNLVVSHLVNDSYFNHLDFLTGIDADKLVYQYVLETMKLY